MDGSWDIGCGTYSWKIELPATATEPEPELELEEVPLEMGEQSCFSEDDFPDHKDIHEADVLLSAMFFCIDAPTEMGPDTPIWERDAYGRFSNTNLHFSIEWKSGCVTEVETLNAQNPLGEDTDSEARVCTDTLSGNWGNCE